MKWQPTRTFVLWVHRLDQLAMPGEELSPETSAHLDRKRHPGLYLLWERIRRWSIVEAWTNYAISRRGNWQLNTLLVLYALNCAIDFALYWIDSEGTRQ